jgi:hypothetical protein
VGFKLGEAERGSTWRLQAGCRGRRARPERWGQREQLGLRQWGKAGEAWSLERYEARGRSVGSGGRVSRGRTPGVRHRVGLQSDEIAAMRKVTNTRAHAGFDQ